MGAPRLLSIVALSMRAEAEPTPSSIRLGQASCVLRRPGGSKPTPASGRSTTAAIHPQSGAMRHSRARLFAARQIAWIIEIIHHVVDAKPLQHGAITPSLAYDVIIGICDAAPEE
jgi:hypothetical protein